MFGSLVKEISKRLSFTSQPADSSNSNNNNNSSKDQEAMDEDPIPLRRQSTRKLSDDEGDGAPGPSRKKTRLSMNKETSNASSKVSREASSESKRGSGREESRSGWVRSISRQSASSTRQQSSTTVTTVTREGTLTKRASTTRTSSNASASGLTKSPSVPRAASLTKKSSSIAPVVPPRKSKPGGKSLWYPSGSYLTVRNDEGGFYLCRTSCNVYNTTQEVRVRWLSQSGPVKTCYKLDHADVVDPAAVLLNVKVEKNGVFYHMNAEDLKETERLLQMAEDVAKGNLSKDDVGSDVEQVMIIEPPAKKPRREPKPKSEKKPAKAKTPKAKAEKKPRLKKTESQKKAAKAARQTKAKKEPKPKRKTKAQLLLELIPNPKIKIREKDPFFEDSVTLPFVSKYAHSRLLFRAVNTKDVKLIKKLLKDNEHVRLNNYRRSVFDNRTAATLAAEKGNLEIMTLLTEDKDSTQRLKNNPPDKILVDKLGTGTYNPRSLGVAFVRQIMASRGCKEGNNALTKDVHDMRSGGSHDVEMAVLRTGLKWSVIKDAKLHFHALLNRVDEALAYGQAELAKDILEEALRNEGFRIPAPIFAKVLGDKQQMKTYPPGQLKMRLKQTQNITPFHVAAVNPCTDHLVKMIAVDPDVHIADRKGRRPIHFAAAATSTAPLELLIKNGGNPYDLDNDRNSCLHYACRANRPHNVEAILKHAKSGKAFFDDPGEAKFGIGGVNRPNRSSKTPMHIAAENGYLDVLKVLVKYEAAVDVMMAVSQFKLTPLMLAAQAGHLACVRFLVDSGAVVERKDRLGRTALMHAAMTGNTNVLSYLLHIGAKPNLGDNSDNTALHYAAAYGWYFAVEILLEAGAEVNKANNWKTTPVSIAYMKGHMGIVDLLLNQPDVDVNFQDENGMTLVSVAAGSSLDPDLVEQMEYLVKDKGALCTLTNVHGETPLHILASNSLINPDVEKKTALDQQDKDYIKTSIEVTKLLLDNGCNPKTVDKAGRTAAMNALQSHNLELLEFLLDVGSPILTDSLEGTTVLHNLAKNHMESTEFDRNGLLKALMKPRTGDEANRPDGYRKEVLQMAKTVDSEGYTPLLRACKAYLGCRMFMNDKLKTEILNFWQKGRDFIKILIDESKSDAHATVQKVKKADNNRETHYCDGCGDWNAFTFMANASVEPAAHADTKKEEKFPGMRMLLPYKLDVEHRPANDLTPLCSAVSGSETEKVKFLVEEAKADANGVFLVKEEKKGKTEVKKVPVICRASKGRNGAAIIEELLKHGADPNACNENGEPLLNSIIRDFQNVDDKLVLFDVLKKYKVDVNKSGQMGWTAIHLAVIHNKGGLNDSIDLELRLIQAGANLTKADDQECLPLHYVFRKPDPFRSMESGSATDPVELCRLIARKMTAAAINTRNKQGETALHSAAFRNASICCLYLIERGAKVNMKDDMGNTPLSIAVGQKFDNTATVLLQKGAELLDFVEANPNFKKETTDEKSKALVVWQWNPIKPGKEEKEKKTTPLFQIAIRNEMPGVSFLILEMPFAKTGVTIIDAIEMAFKEWKYNIALRLLSTVDELPLLQAKREHGRTLFHQFAITSSPSGNLTLMEKVCNMLLDKGVSLTEVDDFECTPVMYCVLQHNFETARELMKKPKVFNSKQVDKFGRSLMGAALWNAVWSHTHKKGLTSVWNFIGYLKTRGMSMNELIDVPLPERTFGIPIQQEKLDYFRSYDVKVTPLILAIHLQDMAVLKEMLALRPDLNQPDSNGVLPIHHAAMVNNLHVMRMLMNHQYDASRPDDTLDPLVQPKATAKAAQAKKKHGGRKFALKRKVTMLSVDDDEDEEEEEEEEEEEDEEAQPKKEEVYRTLKMTSSLDLNGKDSQGRTALHYVADSLPLGTFDSDSFVFLLGKAGARLDVKDKDGKTALDLALEKHAVLVAKMIQKLKKVDEKNMKLSSPESVRVEDKVAKPPKAYNLAEDAQVMLDKLMADDKQEKKVFEHVVDSMCTTQGSLLLDEEQGLYYDVLMRKVDVSQSSWGMYNFYCMQIVHQEGKDLYVLFTRWGRIGDEGQFQHTPYQTKAEAIKEFSSIFRSKTGNPWKEAKDNFQPKSGKYTLVSDELRIVEDDREDTVELELKSVVASKLPKMLQDTVQDLMDVRALKKAYQSSKFRFSAMPFGRMRRDHLLKARGLLDKISELIKAAHETENEIGNVENPLEEGKGKVAELTEKRQEAYEQIASLSSEYYLLIPQTQFAFTSIRPLDTTDRLGAEIQLLNNLLDFEMARKMILGAMFRVKEINPVDYVYHATSCKMQLMAEEDPETQYILQYAYASNVNDWNGQIQAAPQVTAVYRLERPGEEERMQKKGLDNHKLLWHGTGAANVLSILRRGLVIAPPDAPISGHAFGKGIYFSDSYRKSVGYCNNYGDSQYLFVCEVALGKTETVSQANFGEEPKKGYNSRHVLARNQPDKKYNVRLATEAVIALGQWQSGRYHSDDGIYIFMPFSEFIVYDEAQVCLRYLIQVTTKTASQTDDKNGSSSDSDSDDDDDDDDNDDMEDDEEEEEEDDE